jgi:isochorismate synthase
MFSCSDSQSTLAKTQIATETPFVLSTGKEHVRASGIDALLDAKDLTSTPQEAREFFRMSRPQAPAILIGALPFRHEKRPYLVRPRRFAQGNGPYRWSCSVDCKTSRALAQWSATADPTREVYERMVAEALRRLSNDMNLRKVVLGRRLIFENIAALRPRDILCRLASDRGVTTFAVPLPDDSGQQRLLVGATPELLLEKTGDRVLSVPLAGSAKRSADPAEDRDVAEALLRSDKDRREHALVVESVIERLAPYCRGLRWSDEPHLVQTATMWHLGTRVEGETSNSETSSLDLAVALHPTAAVCGMPRDLAAETIAALEPFDRGYFAGAVGWCDAAGDGRWMVTIRCAEITGKRATLFAGAGIVPGSDPHSEAVETSEKFQTMLSALAIDEAGAASGDCS